MIANEIVDENRRSREKGVNFKIDFERAYDRVRESCVVGAWKAIRKEWEFVKVKFSNLLSIT